MGKQRSANDLGFDRFDPMRLLRAIEQITDKRLYVRLQSVLLVARGYSIQYVCQMLGCSAPSLYRWIKCYLTTHQPTDLLDQARTGRPRAAVEISDDRILNELARNPITLGYKVTTWTVATLAHSLNRRYRSSITTFTLYRRMKALGLEYKRPKYVYEEKAPNRAQKKGQSSES